MALEVANVLLMAEWRRWITLAERRQALAALQELPLQVEPSAAERTWHAMLDLAAAQDLNVYDASSLALALRQHRPLASFDRKLRRAAAALGVPLLV